jgi:fumarate hydratase class II
MIFNLANSITIAADGCTNFRRFLVEGTRPNVKKITEDVERSSMLVTARAPVIGYDQAPKIAHHAIEHVLTLKAAALELGCGSEAEAEFDRSSIHGGWCTRPSRRRIGPVDANAAARGVALRCRRAT